MKKKEPSQRYIPLNWRPKTEYSKNVVKTQKYTWLSFLPLSLLVGWYGMNFQGMPELSWTYGYPAVIAVSVLLAVGLIVYFKRKHWF